jgi:chromosome partitioning protein
MGDVLLSKPIIISFANQKGGVGKTTSAVNIAACVAALGYRVLICDLDPQGNTTSGVGVNKKSLRHSMYGALLGFCKPELAVIKTKFKNLSIIPATIELAGAEIELLEVEHREEALRRVLEPLYDDYDFIFTDCPPSLGMLTVNALSCSDGVVIPMQCEYYSLEGLSQLMYSIKKVKQLYNKDLTVTGILITMYNGRLNLSAQVLEELKKYYNDKLFKTSITRSVKLSEAPSFGEPIYYHDKYSKGSLAYMNVAKELVERVL